jgi:hypothetical protein
MVVLYYLGLMVTAFVQNMAFTWSSRSRNSGDPDYHRFAAWASNGIWYFCQVALVSLVWQPVMEGEWTKVAIGGVCYIFATTEGSVFMMKLLLGKTKVSWLKWLVEKDKRQVGSK